MGNGQFTVEIEKDERQREREGERLLKETREKKISKKSEREKFPGGAQADPGLVRLNPGSDRTLVYLPSVPILTVHVSSQGSLPSRHLARGPGLGPSLRPRPRPFCRLVFGVKVSFPFL